MALPRNAESLVEVLRAAVKPISIEEALTQLRERGIRTNLKWLNNLPVRFEDTFEFTSDGKLALVTLRTDSSPASIPTMFRYERNNDDLGAPWWTNMPSAKDLPYKEVVLADVEHKPGRDQRPIITLWCLSALETPIFRAIGAEENVEELASVLSSFEAICAYRAHLQVIPTLYELLGENAKLPPLVLDLLELASFIDPTSRDTQIEQLVSQANHGNLRAAPAIFEYLVESWQTSDTTFAIAHAILQSVDNPWARILPQSHPPKDLHDALRFRPDPLLQVSDSTEPLPNSADAAVDIGFSRLADSLSDYRQRPGQLRMARVVADALDSHRNAAIEAPTGTGKSLAYLVPVAGHAHKEPVVISTHTRLLQTQLRRDALLLNQQGLLSVPFRHLQGVANYICARNVAEAIHNSDTQLGAANAVVIAVRTLATGDVGTWEEAQDADLSRSGRGYGQRKALLHTTASLCDNHQCEFAKQCPMLHRLEGLQESPGIVLANHALVATWLGEQPDENNEDGKQLSRVRGVNPTAAGSTTANVLFPSSGGTVIFDEAHTLEDALASAWTKETGAEELQRQFRWLNARNSPVKLTLGLAQRSSNLAEKAYAIPQALNSAEIALQHLNKAAALVIHEFGGQDQSVVLENYKENWSAFRTLYSATRDLAHKLRDLTEHMKNTAEEAWFVATRETEETTKYRLSAAHRALKSSASSLDEHIEVLWQMVNRPGYHHVLSLLSTSADERVSQDELAKTWLFKQVPLQIARLFNEQVLSRTRSLVLTSATLQVDDSFEFLADRLGISLVDQNDKTKPRFSTSFATEVVASPFDYDDNAILVLTGHLPLLSQATTDEFVEEAGADQAGFLSLSGGKALTLFAARSRMEETARIVRQVEQPLAERGVTLMMQGETAPAELVRTFRSDPGSVLYGLRSYWEGFDAPGEALSYLFLEKPPYPHIADPLEKARQRLIRESGGDPFLDYVVPRTAITFAQGVGRLIRKETDRGAVVVYDRRLRRPSSANHKLLATLPIKNIEYPDDRDDAWRRIFQFVTGQDPDLSNAIFLNTDQMADLLADLRLVEGEDFEAGLRLAALKLFGIDALHDAQLQLMTAILNGRDAIGILPTGFGKSLCFQLPALVHPRQEPFVVISPLQALIKDQVDDLRARRGFRPVAGITSQTPASERSEILRDLRSGKVRLLYISPERFVRDPILRKAIENIQLGALVVDEAHCISSWGHDFRPEFRQIAKAVEVMNDAPKLALTATATLEVQDDIESSLALDKPVLVREPNSRPELKFWRMQCANDRDRTREMLRFVMAQDDKPGIIYASTRAETERLAWVLNHVGVTVRSYHAGMLPEQRESAQEDFLNDTVQVITATTAFGMGVNKPDIGWVLHYDLPQSLEGYAQESGRAARAPNSTATVALLWTTGDIAKRKGWLRKPAAFGSPIKAKELLELLAQSPTRGDDFIIDGEELAEKLEITTDELNVMLAWLERLEILERKADATVRARLTRGYLEPSDHDEKLEFVQIMQSKLKTIVASNRYVELDKDADRCDLSPDELEEKLINWSFENFIEFHPTRRRWRIKLFTSDLDETAFIDLIQSWHQQEQRRLRSMRSYVDTRECLRVLIAKVFGDPPRTCVQFSGQLCEVCDKNNAPWHSFPLDRVPDPEQFVDVPLVVLQIIRWVSRNTTRPWGQSTIEAIALGRETIGDRPLSAAAMSCPQFGALKHVRAHAKRYREALDGLIASYLVEHFIFSGNGRSWQSTRITAAGRTELGGVHYG